MCPSDLGIWSPQASAFKAGVPVTHCFGKCIGISFIDTSSLKVCHKRRISQHQVFNNLAVRGKTSVDWFFGFKLHLVVNEHGELINLRITSGNIDDRKPVPDLLQSLCGKVFADRPQLSQRFPPRSFDADVMCLNPWLNSYFKILALSFLLLLDAT